MHIRFKKDGFISIHQEIQANAVPDSIMYFPEDGNYKLVITIRSDFVGVLSFLLLFVMCVGFCWQ